MVVRVWADTARLRGDADSRSYGPLKQDPRTLIFQTLRGDDAAGLQNCNTRLRHYDVAATVKAR